MQLILTGSADAAGIPVAGCACTLCRQARAVRHLRRRPSCLTLLEGTERLLVEAGPTELGRGDWLDPPDAVLLSSWEPPHWLALVHLHLGKGSSLPVVGPCESANAGWLARAPGRLKVRAVLQAGRESLIGRFHVHPFNISRMSDLLAYGISCGNQRIAYIPVTEGITAAQAEPIGLWHPQAVVLGCPSQGRPAERLKQVSILHEQLGRPSLLVTGIDHHLDQWLTHHAEPLPTGIRIAKDDMRVDLAYLNEHRRLGDTVV